MVFTDLVEFTRFSERRDPEDVRELLSQYFDRCRALINRYGGVVEKFIGDAVMAVWGAPVAREDDAERAVRAALAVVQAVTALGEELGVPELRARAGVLTGHAAVDLGRESEGMVLGDTVNTASRLQSLAAPGSVLVDDVTRRASDATIAYEDAGTYSVKGREQAVHAWTALRVVAGVGGARRSAGVESPFVGREQELRTIIDACERSVETSRAQLVLVVGEAGSGKSRLLWEFFKYVDGIDEVRWWHQGRCLSYGEGVGYWALAEMIRSRAGITEHESPASAREKLRAAVEVHVDDERERRLVEPRLAHLLRLEERAEADRADLFCGWRLFFERMAVTHPVILVFEDLQWADSGLLDFIDYVLEWSAQYPIFVLSLGRSEVRESRPAWQPVTLEPLGADAISAILNGLAPGLAADLLGQISRRAEGIPLYAIETIRMLQDRGVLVQEGSRYVLTSDVVDLDVPETLQALVASRLDGLSASERSLLQFTSVLGQTFTLAAAASISGQPEEEVRRLLEALVGKQILGRDDDPRSPERGQYVFLQALLRTVAYGTLSRQARKARHVAAARHLEQTWPGELRDIAEVLASHYVEAIQADPDAMDVSALRASARVRLTAAGKAAASLALWPEARRYFEHAVELAIDDLERAELLELAGTALWHGGDAANAEQQLRAAIELYEAAGRRSGGSALLTLARALGQAGRLDEVKLLLDPFRQSADRDVDELVRAQALAELARTLMLLGSAEESGQLLDEALRTLELKQSWPELAGAFMHRAAYLIYALDRVQEGIAVLRHALQLAERHDLPAIAIRSRYHLAGAALVIGQLDAAVTECELGLDLARERGDRAIERDLLGQLVPPLVILGRWHEAVPIAEALIATSEDIQAIAAAAFLAKIAVARGDDGTLERCRSLAAGHLESTYVDDRVCARLVEIHAAVAHEDHDEALELAIGLLPEHGGGPEFVVEAYGLAVDALMQSGNNSHLNELDTFVAELPPARATPLLKAGQALVQAERAQRTGDETGSIAMEDQALTLLRENDAQPMLAQALLERARRRRDVDASREAREICTELGATRWLASIDLLGQVADNRVARDVRTE